MHEEDEEWLVEWIQACKDQNYETINDEWSLDKIQDHYDAAETSLFKAGVNRGLHKALNLFSRKLYEYQGKEIQEEERRLDEMEEELEKLNDPELIEYKEERIKEIRQAIDQIKKKRENFLKPLSEGDIEEALEFNE